MKNLIYLLSLIFLVLSFNACKELDKNMIEPSDIMAENRSSQDSIMDYLDLNISSISNMTIGIEDVGIIHDSLLDFQWNYIKENPIIPPGITASSYFETMYSDFFAQFNIEIDFHIQPMLDPLDLESVHNLSGFLNSFESHSLIFQSIMTDFVNVLEDFSDKNTDSQAFIDTLNNLRILSNDLQNESEKRIVQVSIEVALHSYSYWSLNLEEYAQDARTFLINNLEKFGQVNSPGVGTQAAKVNIKEMLEADAVGAWWGARVGVVAAGGPAGGVAVGLAAGAGASAVNIIWQSFWW